MVTILTIASRYKILEGPGGQTRSFMIHERLWNHLQNLITRMFWGQEQFGGGLSGAGSRSGVQKEGLRSLGTIERYYGPFHISEDLIGYAALGCLRSIL